MDDRNFDDLTRAFADTATRRGVLRRLAGGALGAVLGGLGLEEAAAACSRAGQKCGKDRKCCGGLACRGGRCRCKNGLTACGGRCLNTKIDEANCGRCGRRCAAGQTCVNGTCTGGGCGPLGTDANCTRCGDACASGTSCVDGACRPTGGGCPEGQKDCNGGCIDNGACCGDGDCGGGKTCRGDGSCQCPDGLLDCGGTCRQCCTNADCGDGTCENGTCLASPITVRERGDVSFGRTMDTSATLRRDGFLTVTTFAKNDNCCFALRGRIRVKVFDSQREIAKSELFVCETVNPFSSRNFEFSQRFPDEIGRNAVALQILQADNSDPAP